MRKSKTETAETRCRIVDSATAALRQNGIEGTSVNDLMAAAGLTHGGFYRHFGSKDQLVTEACARGFDAMVQTVREACAAAPGANGQGGPAGVAAIADMFLSADHRDERLEGCPFTTLGSELARSDAATRRAATDGFRRTTDLLAEQFPDTDAQTARSWAIAAMSAMVGGITLAKIVDDDALSGEILQAVRALVERVAACAPAAPHDHGSGRADRTPSQTPF